MGKVRPRKGYVYIDYWCEVLNTHFDLPKTVKTEEDVDWALIHLSQTLNCAQISRKMEYKLTKQAIYNHILYLEQFGAKLYPKGHGTLKYTFEYKGKIRTIGELAKIRNTTHYVMYCRLVTLGWDVERAMNTVPKQQKKLTHFKRKGGVYPT